jgi:probable molybdopterin binding protein
VRVVGDEERAIVDALNALRHRYTYVFTTGGIGPTHGDIIADCVAKAFGVPIGSDPRALAILHEWVKMTGAEMNVGAPAHDAHPQGRGSHPQQGVGGTWIGNVIVMAGPSWPWHALECDRPRRISNGSLLCLPRILFGTSFLLRSRTIRRPTSS